MNSFATGAVRQHFTTNVARDPGVHFRLPKQSELNAMEDFQLGLGRTSEVNLPGLTFRNPNATAGQITFAARCTTCHVNAGANRAGVNDLRDTGVEQARIDNCPAPSSPGKCAIDSNDIVQGANHDGGFGDEDLFGDGRWGDGRFNTNPLIEAADTAPFFHDNSAETLEQAISFYRLAGFLNSPVFSSGLCNQNTCGLAGTGFPGTDFQISAMLRILNAEFNIAMAAQRLHFAFELLGTPSGGAPQIQELLLLARSELEDANRVLEEPPNPPLGVTIFDDTNGNVGQAQTELLLSISSINSQLSNGASPLLLAGLLSNLVATSNDHLIAGFYDAGATCAAGSGYDNCRWGYQLGDANVLFDNSGVGPSLVSGQTQLSWTPGGGGVATLTAVWQTAEWTNKVLDKAILTDTSPNPSTPPVNMSGTSQQLPNGNYEHTYSYTVTCVPRAKYRVDIETKVGGISETTSTTVRAMKFCIG